MTIEKLGKTISPMRAIRLKCLNCCASQSIMVKTCSALDCPLWKFRLGLHPFTKKNLKNPLLQLDFFKRMENLNQEQVLEEINGVNYNEQ